MTARHHDIREGLEPIRVSAMEMRAGDWISLDRDGNQREGFRKWEIASVKLAERGRLPVEVHVQGKGTMHFERREMVNIWRKPDARRGRQGPVEPLNPFEQGYVEAALWSTNDDNEEPLDKNYSVEDIAPDTLQDMRDDCTSFMKLNIDDLDQIEPGQAGHWFWLERNGHGSGFFDSDDIDKAAQERLSRSCDEFGSVDLYVGDDGFVHG